MVGTTTNVVTAVEVSAWNEADHNRFEPLVLDTAERFQIAEVSADKAYTSKKNVDLVEKVGAVPYMPFKSNTVPVMPAFPALENAWSRMYHAFAYNSPEFMRHYHRRSNVETTFSMIKAKFGDSVMSKSTTGMRNEVLCKVLAHNVVVVGQAASEFGIDPDFRVSRVLN